MKITQMIFTQNYDKKIALKMKAKFCMFFLIYCTFSFAQWTKLTSSATNQFQSVCFVNANTGFIGGADGTFKTSNGGASWSKIQYSGIDSLWYEMVNRQYIYALDANTIIIGGWNILTNSEVVIKSVDGGATWSKKYLGPFDTEAYDMQFPTSSIGYLVGRNGRILKTTNGGNSWSLQTTNTTADLYEIHFISADTGFVVGDDTFLKTADGGATWVKSTLSGNYGTSVCFINSKRGFVGCNSGTILETNDSGISWSVKNPKLPSYIWDIKFINDTTGFIASGYSNQGVIYKTTTSGKYWEPLPSSNFGWALLDMFFINNQIAYAVGENGTIIKTASGGGQTGPFPYFQPDHATLCEDTATILKNYGPPSYVYKWFNNNVPVATTYDYFFTPIASTSYTIKLVADNGVYKDSISKNYTSPSSLSINPFVPTVNNDSICSGGSIIFTVANSQVGVSYQLKKGITLIGASKMGNGNGLSFTASNITSSAIYSIEASLSNLCGTNKILSTQNIIVVPYPKTTIPTGLVRNPVCINELGQYYIDSSEVNVKYQLLKSLSSIVFPIIQGTGSRIILQTDDFQTTGIYYVIATNALGCTAQMPVYQNNVRALTIEALSSPTGAYPGDTISFTNNSNADYYKWKFGIGVSPDTTSVKNPLAKFNNTGIYNVTLIGTTKENCSDSITVPVEIANKAPLISDCRNYLCKLTKKPIIIDSEIDDNGNYYVAGYFTESPLSYSYYIAKFNKYGNLNWEMKGPNGYNYFSYATTICVDKLGNVYVGGNYTENPISFGLLTTKNYSSNNMKMYLVKIDSVGKSKWIINGFCGSDSNSEIYVTDIKINKSGNIIYSGLVSGYYVDGQIDFADNSVLNLSGGRDGFLSEINPNGIKLDFQTFGGTAYSGGNYTALYGRINTEASMIGTDWWYGYSPRINLDKNDNIYVVCSGTSKSSTASPFIFGSLSLSGYVPYSDQGIIAKYRKDKGWIYAKRLVSGKSDIKMESIEIDTIGNIYTLFRATEKIKIGIDSVSWGVYNFPTPMTADFLVKFDSTVTPQWFTYTPNLYFVQDNLLKRRTYMNDMILTKTGKIAVACNVVDFSSIKSNGNIYGIKSAAASQDPALCVFDGVGNVISINRLGNDSAECAFSVLTDKCDDIHLILGWNGEYNLYPFGFSASYMNKLGFAKFSIDNNCNKANCPPGSGTVTSITQNVEKISLFNPILLYPNPFSGNTVISCNIKETSNVELYVYNSLGQNISTLINTTILSEGIYSYNFNPQSLGYSSGIYTVVVRVNSLIYTAKLIAIE